MTKHLEDLLGRGLLHFACFFCCYGNWRIRLGHSLKDRGRFFVCSGFTSLQPDKVRLRFSFQEPAVTEPKFSGTFFP